MSISATSSSSANAVVKAASAYVNQGAGSTSASSALQEATETPAVTAQEAAKGDQVAKRLLAKQQEAKAISNPTPASEPRKGDQIDQNA
jgi:hypothetical protein